MIQGNNEPGRPSEVAGARINWLSPRVGQIRIDNGVIIGQQVYALVIWNGGHGADSHVQMFIPKDERDSLLTSAFFVLAGDLMDARTELMQAVVQLTARVEALEAHTRPIGG